MQPFALRDVTPTPTALPTGTTLHTVEPAVSGLSRRLAAALSAHHGRGPATHRL